MATIAAGTAVHLCSHGQFAVRSSHRLILAWVEDASCGAPHYARLVRGPGDHVLAWAAQAVAPDARITRAAGLRDGGNPWLLRLERIGSQHQVVLKTGDPASNGQSS